MHDFRSQSIASNTTIVPDCFMPIAIRVDDGICYFGCFLCLCHIMKMLDISEFQPMDVFSTSFLHQFFGEHFLADQKCICLPAI